MFKLIINVSPSITATANIETCETLGKKVKKLRLEHGYSIRKLAKIIDSSPSTISRIENEITKSPSLIVALKLSEALCRKEDESKKIT